MITKKDYCDKDLSLALKEAGYIGQGRCYYDLDKEPHKLRHFGIQVLTTRSAEALNFILAPKLYEAQKFLREEKKLIVLVGFDFCPFTSEIVYNWVIIVNGNTAKKSSYTYDYFEEALSEGVRRAIEILKDGNNS